MKRITLLILLCFPLFINAQQIERTWYGVMNIQGTNLPLEITVTKQEKKYKSSLKSPLQSQQSINMDRTTYKKKTLIVESDLLKLIFTGKNHKDSLVGIIQQNGSIFPITFYTTNKYVAKIERPQTPKEPFNYDSKIIAFTNEKENFQLEGTLTMPKSKPVGLVVFVSGSGQQDRDNTIEQHKSFLVMADQFTNNGIATFRYDDRGVGQSKGDLTNATTSNFAEDTKAAIETLRKDPVLKDIPLGIIGHSEGGIVAYMLAADSKNNIDFIITLAAPTVLGKDLLLTQQRKIGEGMGADPLVTEQNYVMNEAIYDAMIANKNSAATVNKVIDSVGKSTYKIIENQIKLAYPTEAAFVENLHATYSIPWLQYYIQLDPATYIKNIKIPALVYFGTKDVQVDADKNMEGLQHALMEQHDHKFIIQRKENLNHLLQNAITGLPDEYEKIEETIDLSIINEMIEFIHQQNN